MHPQSLFSSITRRSVNRPKRLIHSTPPPPPTLTADSLDFKEGDKDITTELPTLSEGVNNPPPLPAFIIIIKPVDAIISGDIDVGLDAFLFKSELAQDCELLLLVLLVLWFELKSVVDSGPNDLPFFLDDLIKSGCRSIIEEDGFPLFVGVLLTSR